MKKNYSLILRKIIFAFNSISVIGIAIFILYTTRKICDAYVASDFLEKAFCISRRNFGISSYNGNFFYMQRKIC